MIYSNDETDKAERQKNYILTVFVLPIVTALAFGSVCYFASHSLRMARFDSVFCYYFALMAGLVLYGINKSNWLKMPDGTFHNIKGVLHTNKVSMNEPREYEEEYFVSTKDKVIPIVLGASMFVPAIILSIKRVRGILLPIFLGCIGTFMIYTGITALLDKNPILKLAKQGLWTKMLGFVDWNDIAKAQVVIDKSGRAPQTVLEIYLKGTVFAEADKPDQRLFITALKNKEYIETVMDNLIFNRNVLA